MFLFTSTTSIYLLVILTKRELGIVWKSLVFRVFFIRCKLRITGYFKVQFHLLCGPLERLDGRNVRAGPRAAAGQVELAAELLVEESLPLEALLKLGDALVHLGDFGLASGEGFSLLGYPGVLLLV